MADRSRDGAIRAEAGYGVSMRGWFARYDPKSSSWRTSRRSLDGDFTEFSEIWPKWGMTLSGTAYRLPAWALYTRGTACGLWPTLLSGDEWGREGTAHNKWGRIMGNLPTLTVSNAMHGGPLGNVGPVEMKMVLSRETDWTWGYASSEPSEEPLMPEKWRSRMNPCWAEQFMGYPAGWTDVFSKSV